MEFNETQKFTQPILWVIVIGALVFLGWNLQEFDLSVSVWLPFAVIIGIVILFLIMRLKTSVDSVGVSYNFFPFIKRVINWKDIQQITVINYGFVGGWGIRFSSIYGTIYNVKGNKGVFLVLNSGKKIVIGTQKPDEFRAVLKHLGKL